MTPNLKYFIGFIITLSSILLCEAIQMKIQDIRKSKLTDCLVAIIENIERTVWKVSFLTSHDDRTFIGDIVKRIRVPVVVNVFEEPQKNGNDTRVPSDLVVVHGNVGASVVLNRVLWHRDTRFLISYGKSTKMESDFREFWNERVIKVFGVVEETEEVSLYSYQPYQEGDCNNTRPMRLDTWKNGTFAGGGFSFVNEDFRIKTGNGCRLNLSAAIGEPTVTIAKDKNCSHNTEVGGVEGQYVLEFTRRLNFTLTACFARDGHSWGNVNPPRGVLGEIHSRISDFGCGAFAQIPRRYRKVDFSVPYSAEECLTFIVPTGAGRDRLYWLKNLLGNLRPIHWLLISGSFISAVSFLYLFGPYTAMASFMLILNSFLGRSIILPRVTALKIVALFWIIFSLIITNIYQASLGREITLPLESSEIETFRQLLDSDLPLISHVNIFKLFNVDDPVQRALMARLNSDNYVVAEADKRLVMKHDIALVRPVFVFMNFVLQNPSSRGKIGILKDCITNYFPVMVLQKNSPFSEKFNDLILKVSQSGISEYWRSNFLHQITLIRPGFTPVTVKRSLGIFVILLVGLTAAFIAFIGELGLYYLKKVVASKKFTKATLEI